jgi:hypothetical protein
VVLEDFATTAIRKSTGGGGDLWNVYLGEDPNQTYSVSNGMLKVVGDGQDNSSCYTGCGIYWQFFPAPYVWPDGFAQSYVKSGTFTSTVNRMRFKAKCDKNVVRRSDGGGILDIGTYVKPHSEQTPANQGQHYYHGFDMNMYAGRWVLFEINAQPQHIVGGDPNSTPPLDPEWNSPTEGAPVHYMDGLTRFYFDTGGDGWVSHTCYFDDFTFDTVTGAPDAYVSSMTATHSGSAYEVTWATPKMQSISYDVRYSTQSMKTIGFSNGTNGGSVASTGNSYPSVIWKSPAMAESPSGLYVAIRPSGQTAFSEIFIPAMNVVGAAASCDVNHDGTVTSTDVTAEINMALGVSACSNDLNGDGACNVVDVQRVINTVNGNSCRVGL